jgi:hypothetical protein
MLMVSASSHPSPLLSVVRISASLGDSSASSQNRIADYEDRFIPGADAIATAEQKIADLKAQIEANRELSKTLAFD